MPSHLACRHPVNRKRSMRTCFCRQSHLTGSGRPFPYCKYRGRCFTSHASGAEHSHGHSRGPAISRMSPERTPPAPLLVLLSSGLALSHRGHLLGPPALCPVVHLGLDSIADITELYKWDASFSFSRTWTCWWINLAVGIGLEADWQFSQTSPVAHGCHFKSTAVCGMLGGKQSKTLIRNKWNLEKLKSNKK